MGQIGGMIGAMPALTRRRDHNLPQQCWRIYYGDVHAGTISQCVGNPGATPKWQWRCGFHPGSRPAGRVQRRDSGGIRYGMRCIRSRLATSIQSMQP
jgi:hypothetical protein